MQRNHQKISADGSLVLLLVLINVIVMERGFVMHPNWYWLLLLTLPLLLVSIVSRKVL